MEINKPTHHKNGKYIWTPRDPHNRRNKTTCSQKAAVSVWQTKTNTKRAHAARPQPAIGLRHMKGNINLCKSEDTRTRLLSSSSGVAQPNICANFKEIATQGCFEGIQRALWHWRPSENVGMIAFDCLSDLLPQMKNDSFQVGPQYSGKSINSRKGMLQKENSHIQQHIQSH